MTEQSKDKTLIRAQSRLERLEDQRDDIAETLAQIGEDIRDLRARLRAGDTARTGEDQKLLADIRYWLRAARETEAEIDDIRRREAGICGSYGLDLEQACASVRCRLDSLRTCCGEGEVSD